MKARFWLLAVLVLAVAGSAAAQTWTPTTGTTSSGGTTATPPATPGTTTAATTPPATPALEPGISERTPPAFTAMQRGHRAFIARDYDAALSAYREAAMATPPPAVAHFFIGCALRAKNQFDDAIEAFRTASRLAGDSDPGLKAMALFNIGMTLDILGQLDRGKEAWLEYKTWVQTHASIPGFGPTADGHVAAIDRVIALDQQYAAVRQRIAERAAAAAATPAP